MKTKFTSGEWGLVYTKNRTIEVRSDQCVLICEIDLTNEINNPTPIGAVANAKLIVKSPELLKGCLAAIAIFRSEGIDENHPIVGEVFAEITSAVKQAIE